MHVLVAGNTHMKLIQNLFSEHVFAAGDIYIYNCDFEACPACMILLQVIHKPILKPVQLA